MYTCTTTKVPYILISTKYFSDCCSSPADSSWIRKCLYTSKRGCYSTEAPDDKVMKRSLMDQARIVTEEVMD